VDLNIRNFPEDLHGKITRAAFDQKKSLKAWLIELLEALCDDRSAGLLKQLTADAEKSKSVVNIRRPVRSPVRNRKHPAAKKRNRESRDREKKPRGAHSAKTKICSTHQQAMRDFGNKWLCDGPPQHTELK